jgi:hypothetical protein
MRKAFAILAIASVLSMTGCASQPIRNFFRGASCLWCGPTAACDTCTTNGSTSFAPGYDTSGGVMQGGVAPENLPNPAQIGPAN